MTKSFALIVAGLMAGAAAPAMAQDADSPFTGLRVQGEVGYDQLGAGSSIDDDSTADNDQSIEGVGYGLVVGYDFDLGGAVAGIEASIGDSTADVSFDDGDFEGFGQGSVGAGRDLYVGARIGGKIADDLLLYAKGGYTRARLDALASDGTEEFTTNIDLDGWRLGAGVEYAMSDNMFFNVEYRYSKYEDAEVDFEGDAPDTETFGVDLDRHQVMAGVGMRF